MERHGSESYFVLGGAVLTESVGGRERTLAAADEDQVPPFRFSRMGPKGTQRQLGEPNRKRIGNVIAAGDGGTSQIPAGFMYLGQLIDHDLTSVFMFSAGSGDLGGGQRLRSNWIADSRRLYDFKEAGRANLAVSEGKFNRAMRIDTTLANPSCR